MKTIFLLPAMVLVATTTTALACACCAEPGFRETTTFQMQDWLADEIVRVRIDGTAHLFLDACGMDCVRGITNPQESYDVSLDIDDDVWRLDLGAQDAPVATLRWTTPHQLTLFSVDQSPEASSGDATLYSEARMNVELVGSDAFTHTMMPAELVFTGQGNACLDASRMRHWHLSVRTEETRFKLYGDLALVPQ